MPDETTPSSPRPWWWTVASIAGLLGVGAGLMLITSSDRDDRGDAISDEPVPTVAPTTTDGLVTTTDRATFPHRTDAPTTSISPRTTNPVGTFHVGDRYRPIDIDDDDPAVAGRGLPDEPDEDEPPPSTLAPPSWAASTRITEGGHVSVDVGCADDGALSALDWFFSARVGPVLGWDYQHVYPLGGDRYLWLFQDAFVDHTGIVTSFDDARFVHNAALVQEGACFRLLHRGTTAKPEPFEVGDGRSQTRTTWWWPMGGELVDGRVWVYWAEMLKDPYDPDPPDGLGWHPVRTYLASYDATTLERLSFDLAPASGVDPIYGYAVSSDDTHTYLFGNTFEQNMIREGGFWSPDHSATRMWLARVPRGRLTESPEYRTANGWSTDPGAAVPIVDRFFVENPMQPRFSAGQWVSATAVDGYWGDSIVVDVAEHPWGPWHTVHYADLRPRNDDPKMNTYHAHVLPWRDGYGSVLISVSNNARNMRRDAWYSPHRYRPTFLHVPYTATPTPTTTSTTTTTTTIPPTSTTVQPSTTPAPSTTPTTVPRTTSTTTSTSTTSSTTTTTPTTTTTVPRTASTTSTTTTSTTTTSTSTTSTTVPGTSSTTVDR